MKDFKEFILTNADVDLHNLKIRINPCLYEHITSYFRENLSKNRYYKLFTKNFILLYYISYISYHKQFSCSNSMIVYNDMCRRSVNNFKETLLQLRLIDIAIINKTSNCCYSTKYNRVYLPVDDDLLSILQSCKSKKNYTILTYKNINYNLFSYISKRLELISNNKRKNKNENNINNCIKDVHPIIASDIKLTDNVDKQKSLINPDVYSYLNFYSELRLDLPENISQISVTSEGPHTIMSHDEYERLINDTFKNISPVVNENDSRVYSIFHRLKKDFRQYLRFENEQIFEYGDIPCSHWLCLYGYLKSKNIVPEKELEDYASYVTNLNRGDDFYSRMKDFINGDISLHGVFSREDAKHVLNIWINEDRKKLKRCYKGNCRDQIEYCYRRICEIFEIKWPNIFKFIISTDNKGNDSIHNILCRFETLMLSSIINKLNNTLYVKCFPLHDSMWCKKSDFEKLTYNNIDFNTECLEYINK